MRLVEAFSEQARGCGALGSPLYAGLLTRLAEDVEAGGPTARVLAGHEDDPGPSALALRLLGSVHRLVLQRRAGELGVFFPSVGGTWDPERGADAVLALLERDPDAVREWLDRAPQTNEVGRSTALLGGLRHLLDQQGATGALPVRLFEIGSSGGLNLLADRFDPAATDWLDPARVPVLPGGGFAEAVGSDLLPVDATTTEGRLALTAYVWPDQRDRHERLRAALALAQQHPPVVRRQGAGDFVESVVLAEGTTTVLWHSVMWQYLPHEEQARVADRIAELGRGATPTAPFAHLRLEPRRPEPGAPHEFQVVLTAWPGGEEQVLGTAAPHGVPVVWRSPS